MQGPDLDATPLDEEHMREILPVHCAHAGDMPTRPFGALIVSTRSGKLLMRATNAVRRENDPSLACGGTHRPPGLQEAEAPDPAGYTMYSTCEPCPMCMANALWARLDRVVFGATIADANRHCLQIHIPAKEVARARTCPASWTARYCATFATRSSRIRTCKRPSELEHAQEILAARNAVASR